jgi:N-acetylmuramoyl-L-alanine amidase
LRQVNNIIIHCSDSLWGCAREIRQWHLARGFSDIGYHFVILNGVPTFNHQKNMHRIPVLDGSIEAGRYLDDDGFISDVEVGAHCLGYNDHSIGVCLVGAHDFTAKQMEALYRLLVDLSIAYHIPAQNILGHYETASGKAEGKTCPNLDMNGVRDNFERRMR